MVTKAKENGNPKDVRRFYTDVDKGSDKPAFCKTQHMKFFKEETDGLRTALKTGMVEPTRRMKQERDLKKREAREQQHDGSMERAKKIIAEDPDGWRKRRSELAEKIADGMPSRKDVRLRRVNPHMNLRREKKEGLGEMKKEYIIISRAMGEESNTSFLQKD